MLGTDDLLTRLRAAAAAGETPDQAMARVGERPWIDSRRASTSPARTSWPSRNRTSTSGPSTCGRICTWLNACTVPRPSRNTGTSRVSLRTVRTGIKDGSPPRPPRPRPPACSGAGVRV